MTDLGGYRPVKALPPELYEHCVILLEEKMCMSLHCFNVDGFVSKKIQEEKYEKSFRLGSSPPSRRHVHNKSLNKKSDIQT